MKQFSLVYFFPFVLLILIVCRVLHYLRVELTHTVVQEKFYPLQISHMKGSMTIFYTNIF